ncbi:MAG: M14 family zinc carboxypeptidase, partial [Halanaerobiales bacterium]
KIIEEYTESLNKNKSLINYDIEKILNRVTFLFIPMVNPDGIEIAVNGIDSLKNKDFYIKANEGSNNFERWKANSRGVDLNKQFNADWKRTKSTEKPHFSDYKGPFFESEPESKALADLTRNNHISAVVCFHHSGRVIYWYYKQGKSTFKRDQELVKKISKINGYDPVKPEESDTKAAGYKDWFIKKFNKPGFTIEIGNKDKSKKPLPENKLPVFYKENREVLLELAENL